MGASPNDFIDVVVGARNLVVTSAGSHVFRLEPRESALAWYCDLDDGTPTGDNDPASFVRWVSPAFRVVRSETATAAPQLDVRRPGPQSDLGRMVARLGRLAGRSSGRSAGDGAEGRFAYTDPHGVIDAPLRQRIEHWPSTLHGDGVVRPAELWSIHISGEGLIVESVSWWGSAPALDHQIALAIGIADRLTAQLPRGRARAAESGGAEEAVAAEGQHRSVPPGT